MSKPSTDIAVLSRLLDEAIDLPWVDVQPWLDRLPPEYGHLR